MDLGDRNINGCAVCDHPQRGHGQRWRAGWSWHTYIPPSDAQRLRRLKGTSSLDNRPSFDEYYLRLAHTASIRGDCRRSQVGAIAVLEDGYTAFLGYNGTDPGKPGCLEGMCPRGLKSVDEVKPYSDYSDCIGVHAEDNLIRTARRLGASLLGASFYVTRRPCTDCRTLLVGQGALRVVWGDPVAYEVEEF